MSEDLPAGGDNNKWFYVILAAFASAAALGGLVCLRDGLNERRIRAERKNKLHQERAFYEQTAEPRIGAYAEEIRKCKAENTLAAGSGPVR